MDPMRLPIAAPCLLCSLLLARFACAAVDGETQQADAEAARFDVWEYRVLGNTSLPAAAVERAVYPHLGADRAIADIQAARESLERAYRDAGYGAVFVDIPEQDVDEGIVRLKVTEGRLEGVRVTGARYYSQRKLLAQLPAARTGEVLHLPSLQQELRELNAQSPDRVATPVLKSGRAPGTVDLELKVDDHLPLHGSVELNDRYTADTTRLRLNAGLSYTNLFQRSHALSLQYQGSPEAPDEVEVFAGTYSLPLGASGGSLVFSGIYSDTDVAAVGTLGVLGRGKIFGARILWPLTVPGWSQSLSAGIDYKDVAEVIQPLPSDGAEPLPDLVDRPIDYLVASVSHNAFWRGERLGFSSSLGANFGARSGVNRWEEFHLKRYLAPPNFFYLRGTLGAEYALWKGFSVATRFAGQYSPTPLISNEQFSIGGIDSVRGYLEAEQFGDYGFSASLELRSPSLWAAENGGLRLLGFTDAGVVRLVEALPGQASHADLSSAGLGLRFEGLGGLWAGLDWAYPLVPSNRTMDGDDRVHFTFGYSF